MPYDDGQAFIYRQYGENNPGNFLNFEQLKLLHMKKSILLFATAFIFSCSSDSEQKDDVITPDPDTVVIEEASVPVADTVGEVNNAPEVSAEASSIESFEKASEGPSFCDCVKKQKDLDDQLAAAEDDQLVDELLQKSEELRNGECQVLKAGPQMTSAQKKERERKVKACLGS